MRGSMLEDDTVDLTPLITKLGSPITCGPFSQIYRCTIEANKGPTEVAVKVIIIDHNRTMAKIEKAMRRELRVWFRLSHSTIVPLLGIAYVESPLPALVSQWMPFGTLNIYLEKEATALTASTKVALAKGIADGLNYLHSENVVHGDLQPVNVLIDGSGNPRLAGFGIATIVGDPELQLTTTTADRGFDSRWRAPELIGVDCDPEIPTFESDIYSFGSIMFFIISGDIPWKEKKRSHQISIELSRRATPARPENIHNDFWNLIQRCWSWNPGHRPGAACVIEYIDQYRNDDTQESHSNAISDAEQRTASITTMRSESKAVRSGRGQHTLTAIVNTVTLSGSQRGSSLRRTVTTAARSDAVHDDRCAGSQEDARQLTENTKVYKCITQSRDGGSQASTSEPQPLPEIQLALPEDLTGQIFGTINDYVASGAFGNVYKCEWRRPSGSVKVAVKTFRHMASAQDLRRFRRETAIWAHLVHDNIVTLYGTTEGFGPTTALVSRWFPDGTLFHLVTEQGATLTIKSKLKLLHGIASGLYYLHSFPVVHGDIASSNVLVEIKDGEYNACLTDFGLSNILYGHLKEHRVEESIVRAGAIRWTAPELLRSRDPPFDIKPTTQNDMYSFGRVMFHLLTLTVPWHDIDEYKIIQKIQNGEDIPRPEVSEAMSDVTDTRWNHIEQCWSIDPSARPCAFTAMNFITEELEALKQNDVLVGGVLESHQSAHWVTEQAGISTLLSLQSSSRTIIPSRKTILSSPLARLSFSTVSSLSLTGPLNVLLFGETGVGKSSIINLIVGRDVAQTFADAETCTLRHTSHEVSLGNHRFKLWEISSLDSMGFFRTFFTKWRLKKSYNKLYRDDGVYLLLYCMRGSRAQRALIKDYKFFTDIVGSTATAAGGVPVAAVVTSLEDYPMDMDKWWTKNKDNLESLGMRFSKHACITSLPDDPHASSAMRARRHQSEQAIRHLIYESYQAGP